MNKYMIGIDIGGSTIKIGIVHLNGDIFKKWEIPTNQTENGKYIVEEMWNSLEKNLSTTIGLEHIIGIGVGAPGFVDSQTGIVYEAVNIGWVNFQLANELRRYSKLPVYVENDANLAALGEHWLGAAKDANDVIAVTLGTGVGGGIISDGKIVSGFNGTAGEIGHIIMQPNGYQCNCGRRGCLDTIVSARGIVNRTIDQLDHYPSSIIYPYMEQGMRITTKDIFTFAKEGDSLCMHIIAETADYLGFALASMASIVNPSIILIGGGVSRAGNQLIDPVKKAFRTYSLKRIHEHCDIKVAELKNDAGIIGASYLVLSNSKVSA